MSTQTVKPSPLASLFSEHRLAREMTQQDVADQVTAMLPAGQKLTQQSYAAFERGKVQTSKHSAQIAKVLGIPLEQLLAVSSPDLREAPTVYRSEGSSIVLSPIEVWDDDTPLGPDEVELPFYKEVELSAGQGSEVMLETDGRKLRFGKRSLQRRNISVEAAACVPVIGNSMEPVLPSGSACGVNTADTRVLDGKMYAIDHGGQLRVKLLYRLPGGGLRLKSYNADEHPDETYDGAYVAENIRVIGKVFWYSVLL